MKIVLAGVNAKYIHSNPALYSLRAYAQSRSETCREEARIVIREFTINQLPGDILRELYQEKPDLLAFSCYIWNIGLILELADTLHKILPDVPVWLGGPEVSFEEKSFLSAHPALTGIMRGEGEVTFLRLIRTYLRAENHMPSALMLSEIPGIIFSCGGEAAEGPAMGPEDLPQMKDLPFLYAEPGLFENRIPYYESSRGCPFSCSYCLSALEKGIRLRPLPFVKRELDVFLAGKVSQVKFVDRTFNANHEHAAAIWNYIREHDNGITNFHFELEANLLREEELSILKSMRPGLVQVEIGVQSANPKTLAAVHRNPDISRICHAAGELISAGNIHVHLDLIAGLPYEDYESFRSSFDRLYALRPHELQLGFLKLLKGSIIRAEAERYGMEASTAAPYEILKTDWLSFEDVLRLKLVEEMLEVYYNSRQFSFTVRELEKYFGSAMEMYEALGNYYKEHGLLEKAHSRYARFEILLLFAHQTAPDRGEEFAQLAKRDLYLRENAKSRPEWAKECIPEGYTADEWKKTVHRCLRESGRDAGTPRMRHLECFSFWDGKKETRCILFDYGVRNPVTKDAAFSDVTEELLKKPLVCPGKMKYNN